MKVVLFTNARDEPHLREWAAHHLLLGFDAIVIYDHLSMRPLRADFAGFDPRVRVIPCTMSPPIKMPLMKMSALMAKQMGADWMLYLDADEFLVLNTTAAAPAFMRQGIWGVKRWLAMIAGTSSDISQIAVNWLMYGTSGIKDELVFPRDLILDRFVESDETLDQHVKCFVRPGAVADAVNPHFYVLRSGAGRSIGAVDGRPYVAPFHTNVSNIPYYKAPAYIAHYVFQSEATYRKRKLALPRDDNGGMRGAIDEDCSHIHKQYCGRKNNQLARSLYAKRVREFLQQKYAS